ncbi:exo-alpha-sialidase [Trypanosoma cruzi]|nr:exo-alpha-sialidase [Trypanosoma cruzi]
MQKNTVALRSTHALPPVVLLLSLPTHPLLRHRRTSPSTGGETPVGEFTARKALRHVQQLGRNQSALAQGTLNNTHLLQAANITPAARRKGNSRVPICTPPEGRSSQSLVRVCGIACLCGLVCLSVPIIAE